jgi:hypothetical protein
MMDTAVFHVPNQPHIQVLSPLQRTPWRPPLMKLGILPLSCLLAIKQEIARAAVGFRRLET